MSEQNNQPCTRVLLSYYPNGNVISNELSKDQIIVDSQKLCMGLSGEIAHWIGDYDYIFKAEELVEIIEICIKKLVLTELHLPNSFVDRIRSMTKKINDSNG